MIDDAGRERIQLEVSHLIRSDNHCTLLLVKGIYDRLQGMFVLIKIVAIQLNGKLSARCRLYTEIPTTTDTQIITCGDEMNHPFVIFESIDHLSCSIRRMIVDNDEIELKCGLLTQHGTDSRLNGSGSITNRNNHRSLCFETICTEVDAFKSRFEPSPDRFQMLGAGLFHLNLPLTIARVYIIKLPFTARATVFFHFTV